MKRTQIGRFNCRLPVAVVVLVLLLLAASAEASSWVDNLLGASVEAPRPETVYLALDSPARTNRRFKLFPGNGPQAYLYDLLSCRYDGYGNFIERLGFRVDYMHARYYSPNLGRFLSVDPIGGTVGSSQSWNRYSYVLNNPLSLIDPDGRDIEVATGTRRDREAKRMLVQAIRRPGFRAEIAAIANDPSFLLTYRSGSLNTSKELITARAFPEASTLDVGLATVKTGEGGKRVGTDLKMDVDAIGLSQDPSGVSTVGHEINAHVKDIRDGKPFSEIAATDIAPEGGISPADQIGQDTLNEKTDISTKEAKEILAKWAAETAARRANSN